ncbi:hypothetical protein FQ087_13465 [Sporosarcina sp. ANT_H38]|uniref:pectate lyase-like adhesive domain-containing protein n=1 Tax=Sporosarcina sp. ANT_H38 TaxID=2597358 RepID=UPI0011F0BE34|nr:pectate lyase-like adhesive domain-containing protein [Sporosarcina sp. ANT_H38]KAA0955605.1 hypothetical protein FQ087_13465 [Sporosarcina sp. ANT_H38]
MGTAQGLVNALASDVVKTITLTSDLTLTTNVAPKAGVTIDGGGKILTLNATSAGNTSAEGLFIQYDGVTIKNITITQTGDLNKDNLVEIYGKNATLENVTVNGGVKAGIYVNNNGKSDTTVTFNKVATSGNAWGGVGIAAQQNGDKVTANFLNFNSDETVGVYTEGTTYAGTYVVSGLTGYTESTVGTQQHWKK